MLLTGSSPCPCVITCSDAKDNHSKCNGYERDLHFFNSDAARIASQWSIAIQNSSLEQRQPAAQGRRSLKLIATVSAIDLAEVGAAQQPELRNLTRKSLVPFLVRPTRILNLSVGIQLLNVAGQGKRERPVKN